MSDSLTVGLVLALIFGALVFYLYTRIGQIEKRVSLTENILLDLKMATENTLMAMGTPSFHPMETVERVEPVSAPEPMGKDEVEEVAEEEFYKTVLEQAAMAEVPVVPEAGSKVEPNYEAMTLKELKDEAKRRGLKVGTNAHKKDLIGLLKGQGQVSVLEPVPGSSEGPLEEGFPVELNK